MYKLKGGTQWCPHDGHTAHRVEGAWRVIWRANGKRYFKRFRGDKPKESGAIDFGKKLQERGFTVDIVSGRPFRKPLKTRVPDGQLWCCYCLKVRTFVFKGLRHPDGSLTPALWRCPVCHMSIRDGAIRDNNNFVMIVKLNPRAQERKAKVPSEKTIRKRRYQRAVRN